MAKSTTKSATKPTSKTVAKSSKSKAPAKTASTKTVSTLVGNEKAAKSAVRTAPKPVVVQSETPVVSAPALKKKELIDVVTERSGVKRRDAKPVVEAMLAVLGQALNEGREVNAQPLGKVKINRKKDVQGGSVLIAKVRQSDRKIPPKDPLAKAAE